MFGAYECLIASWPTVICGSICRSRPGCWATRLRTRSAWARICRPALPGSGRGGAWGGATSRMSSVAESRGTITTNSAHRFSRFTPTTIPSPRRATSTTCCDFFPPLPSRRCAWIHGHSDSKALATSTSSARAGLPPGRSRSTGSATARVRPLARFADQTKKPSPQRRGHECRAERATALLLSRHFKHHVAGRLAVNIVDPCRLEVVVIDERVRDLVHVAFVGRLHVAGSHELERHVFAVGFVRSFHFGLVAGGTVVREHDAIAVWMDHVDHFVLRARQHRLLHGGSRRRHFEDAPQLWGVPGLVRLGDPFPLECFEAVEGRRARGVTGLRRAERVRCCGRKRHRQDEKTRGSNRHGNLLRSEFKLYGRAPS